MTEIKINKGNFDSINLQSGFSHSSKLHVHIETSDRLNIRNYKIRKIGDIEYLSKIDFENIRLFV